YSIAAKHFPGKKIKIYANGSLLEELSSNFYNVAAVKDSKGKKQVKRSKVEQPVLVKDMDRPFEVTDGLQNRHIALWHSHGLYFDQNTQRWEWQRCRLFQTVEDKYTQSYVIPFIVPMLENAGANVLLPRERDIQKNEVVVDNDKSFGGYTESNGSYGWKSGDSFGFANSKASYVHGENPFEMGTYRVAQVMTQQNLKGKTPKRESVAQWNPNIPESGEYAVYISYKTLPNSTDAAYYRVKFKDGEREFKVNQQMGGGTWIYLGTFLFDKGADDQGVYLTNMNKGAKSANGVKVVTADGVRFGGGMGNIARTVNSEVKLPYEVEPFVSGYPRFVEGSRVWLQWAGYADTVYSQTNNMNDYTDDYASRGRWVNVLSGGSKMNPDFRGLNIPVDLSFAFHTDAGIFPDDSIVGTLMIYTKISNGSDKYPTGESRMLGRDYADIVQTQIVDDIRATFDPNWSRRGLWDRSYAESRTPNVPAVLLEFLSHQNFADMKYGHDPDFKFLVSRAIYKGMLKFLSLKDGIPYVVQPLPVTDFAAELEQNEGRNLVRLSWSPVEDKLEPTAVAKQYIVYTRVNGSSFDNGVIVDTPYAVIPVESNKIYSFKVAALNEGGASFPSEILSVGVAQGADVKNKTVMVVNGFTRVSGPASFQSKDSTIAGFYNAKDHGVPYLYDLSFTGDQYEFRRDKEWITNDDPGHAASYADFDDKIIAGNTFDYPYVHGKAFMKLGYSFVSSSAGAVISGNVKLEEYPIVDFIMGKQVQTYIDSEPYIVRYETFPVALQKAISDYAAKGGNILVSGSYIGSDLWNGLNAADEGKKFAQEVLKFKWSNHFASKNNIVKSAPNPFGFNGKFTFNNQLNDKIYIVETPDGLLPASKDAYTIFRYPGNNISAGVAYSGTYNVVSLGFPIETLESSCQIDRLMEEITNFFEKY
ncbi:MAG: N-acetylmuramoyl-L-alanine amidase, partial [Bacteroidales bacterium]|nr:N-acetylmuramoyl-L-alanine amidase [Bacteroidales bacterium]